MLGSSRVAAQLVASQGGLSSTSELYVSDGARDSVVGSGTMLQAGMSRFRFLIRSPDFSIDLYLPAPLLPWGRLSLQQLSQLSRRRGSPDVSQPYGSPRPLTGTALPFIAFMRL
jgi:hypothetical protein